MKKGEKKKGEKGKEREMYRNLVQKHKRTVSLKTSENTLIQKGRHLN